MDVHDKISLAEADDLSMLAGGRARSEPPYLDYDPFGYRIAPCGTCSSWWAEVVHQADCVQFVREWHDPDCAYLAESR